MRSVSAPSTAPTRAATSRASQKLFVPVNTASQAYAPHRTKEPWAKFSTPISPKIKDRPAETRKKMAARARPLMVSVRKVAMSDSHVAPQDLRAGGQLLHRAALHDAALVQDIILVADRPGKV